MNLIFVLDDPFIRAAEYAQGRFEPEKSNNPPESAREPQKSANEVFRNVIEQPPEKPQTSNNPADLVAHARIELGKRYGLGRPLRKTELARLTGLAANDHGGTFIGQLEKGHAVLSGPLEVVIRMLLDGHASPRHDQALASRYRGRGTRPASPEKT